MASIIKAISQIFIKSIELLSICLNFIKSIFTYFFAITISISKFAELLILIGSVILIIGVLFKNPTEIVHDSILANDKPGMIVALYYPGKIQEFIRSKNKVILGLTILVCGFLISVLSSNKDYNIFLIKWILLTLLLIYIIGLFIAGYNRHSVIINWKDNKCRYHWLVTDLLDKTYLNNMLIKLTNTKDAQEFLYGTLIRLNYVNDALNIEAKSEFKDNQNPSLQEIKVLQLLIKKDVNNTSLFYYFLKPKRLLKDIFMT